MISEKSRLTFNEPYLWVSMFTAHFAIPLLISNSLAFPLFPPEIVTPRASFATTCGPMARLTPPFPGVPVATCPAAMSASLNNFESTLIPSEWLQLLQTAPGSSVSLKPSASGITCSTAWGPSERWPQYTHTRGSPFILDLNFGPLIEVYTIPLKTPAMPRPPGRSGRSRIALPGCR